MSESKCISCGLLMYTDHMCFIGHPGGPYYEHKSFGVWSIPKGLLNSPDENYFMAAKREFEEETGITPPRGISEYIYLNSVNYNGKEVHCWAFKGDGTEKLIKSNPCEIEYPEGCRIVFPELDKAQYVNFDVAKLWLNPKQAIFIDRLRKIVHNTHPTYNVTAEDMQDASSFAEDCWIHHVAHGRDESLIKKNIVEGKLGEIAFAHLFEAGPVNFKDGEDKGWDFIVADRKVDIKTTNKIYKERVYINALHADIYVLMFYDLDDKTITYAGKLSRLDIQHRKLLTSDDDGNTYIDKMYFK